MDWLLIAWPVTVLCLLIGAAMLLWTADVDGYRGVHERPVYAGAHRLPDHITARGRARVGH